MIHWELIDSTGRTWFSGITTSTEPLRVEQGHVSAMVFAGETRPLAVFHRRDGLPALRLISWPLQ